MSKKEASPISLENLKNDIQSFVEKVADEAIQQSETYSQAIFASFEKHQFFRTWLSNDKSYPRRNHEARLE